MEDESASSLSPSEIADDESQTEVPKDKPRGRPVGKPDSTQRYRRTAQEISDDKIKVVQMKLDAMKESEALKLVNKKSRRPPAVAVIKKSGTVSLRDRIDEEPLSTESPSSNLTNLSNLWEEERSPRPPAYRRQSLYDSWFPSSPRTMR